MTEYLVNVDVLALHGICFSSDAYDPQALPSPYCLVEMNQEEPRYTDVQHATANSTINNYFSFLTRMNGEEFQRAQIRLTVMHKRDILSKMVNRLEDETVGTSTLSVDSIYKGIKLGSVLKNSWFMLTNAEKPSETRGWVLLNVGVYGGGDVIPSRVKTAAVDEGGEAGGDSKSGESGGGTKGRNSTGGGSGGGGGGAAAFGQVVHRNLRSRVYASPELQSDKEIFQMHVFIHFAQHLTKQHNAILGEFCSPYVTIKFATLNEISTTIKYNTSNPLWNEDIRLPLVLPCWSTIMDVKVWTYTAQLLDPVKINEFLIDISPLINRTAINPYWVFLYDEAHEVTAIGTYSSRSSHLHHNKLFDHLHLGIHPLRHSNRLPGNHPDFPPEQTKRTTTTPSSHLSLEADTSLSETADCALSPLSGWVLPSLSQYPSTPSSLTLPP